jgi:hypothetical protein
MYISGLENGPSQILTEEERQEYCIENIGINVELDAAFFRAFSVV